MRRVLFRCGPLAVYSFRALLYVGIVLGVFAQEYAAVRLQFDPSRVFLGTLLTLVPALFGARLLYLVLRSGAFRTGHLRMVGSTGGGAAMYGGLLLAVGMWSWPTASAPRH
jgi:prolipoprotein diacylglyceryltransferase